ncbi:MAG TPA: hypothetical protein VHC69_34705 [Polyangiaceae bacterium]|nr:hypothetical protein [Polyangiaceae bacterium]
MRAIAIKTTTLEGSAARRSSSVGAALAIGALALTGTRTAHADKKTECATAYEQSQVLRASAKLHAARDALVICAQDSCPSFVQSDCTQWLTELQREMPTVVLAIKDQNGADASGVKVTIDGDPVTSEHEGSAIAVDPGRHVFRFELDGAAPIEREIVVRQGEKDRIVEVSFERERPAPPPPAPVKPLAPAVDDAAMNKPGPLRPYAYVAGGVGAAGLIGFTVLGLVGKSQENDLASSGCKPNCSKSVADDIRLKYVLADVSLGIGLAGLGTGVVLYFLSRPKPEHRERNGSLPITFDVRTTRSAAYATMSGRF